ncbi:MAG: hypothetical protein JST64_03705 [Actinobacteria bacterium]|nr:hypothetical protein [Actinomycetota bacterium]
MTTHPPVRSHCHRRPRPFAARARDLIAVTVLAVAVLFGVAACVEDDAGVALPVTTRSTATRSAAPADPASPTSVARSATLLDAVCAGRSTVADVGTVTDADISEASGVVAGRRTSVGSDATPWWVHNDSGDAARVFAIDGSGAVLATVDLDGVQSGDFEDIAAGPGTARSEPPLLYVGDIGNNRVISGAVGAAMAGAAGGGAGGGGAAGGGAAAGGVRDVVRVHRFEEPEVPSTPAADPKAAPVLHLRPDTIVLRYPDGAHDAEAMLVDPLGGDLLVITKDWTLKGRAGVYRIGGIAELADGTNATLESVGTVELAPGELVTGADVTRDGTVVALRSYGAVHLYRRVPGQPLWSAFDGAACAGPVPDERQGESIGFAADGGSYMTLSEGKRPVLHLTAP